MTVEEIKLPMVCACNERRAPLDAKVAAGDWSVDKLIYTLQWVKSDTPGHPHDAKIEIVSDMWMRVTLVLSTYDVGESDNEDSDWYVAKKISVECDRVLDGLLRLHEYTEKGE